MKHIFSGLPLDALMQPQHWLKSFFDFISLISSHIWRTMSLGMGFKDLAAKAWDQIKSFPASIATNIENALVFVSSTVTFASIGMNAITDKREIRNRWGQFPLPPIP